MRGGGGVGEGRRRGRRSREAEEKEEQRGEALRQWRAALIDDGYNWQLPGVHAQDPFFTHVVSPQLTGKGKRSRNPARSVVPSVTDNWGVDTPKF